MRVYTPSGGRPYHPTLAQRRVLMRAIQGGGVVEVGGKGAELVRRDTVNALAALVWLEPVLDDLISGRRWRITQAVRAALRDCVSSQLVRDFIDGAGTAPVGV